MNWKELVQKAGTVLLVSVFALCFAVALWKLSGGHEELVCDREATLAQRYDLLAAARDWEEAAGSRAEMVLQTAENRAVKEGRQP